jgi:adenylosuccinate lyase
MGQSFDGYLSPFSWRYGSEEMRGLWSEVHRRRLWRRIWVALAEAQEEAGLVAQAQVVDLIAHCDQVDIDRSLQIEAEIHHDVMAELKAFAEQSHVGGGIIHLGATSADIEDNADALRMRDSMSLILERLKTLLVTLGAKIERWADTPCMAFTHIQPAEPTTVGYRFAQYAQDFLIDLEELRHVATGIRGKGFRGATGTSASFAELLKDSPRHRGGVRLTPADLEAIVMEKLGLSAFHVSTQTYPRKQDWLVVNSLSGLACSLYKLAFDIRLLQSPPIGEWSEPFGAKQVGSSAMPFKRNPINAENIDSLARLVAVLPRIAWDNAAHSLLERTLDDKANRRIFLPQAYLATDEMLLRATRIVDGLEIYEDVVMYNLDQFGTFAATERVLMAAARAGADRQVMHEIIRQHSMAAWEAVRSGRSNPLKELLINDVQIADFVAPEELRALLSASEYVGDAPRRAREMARLVQKSVAAPITSQLSTADLQQ